ncbi:MAG: ribosome biogenesis GTP-binding protein YihA/YsxC [Thermoanaerobaculia bacterium]
MKVESAEFARSAHRASEFIGDDLPQFAFIGRSNVGKSSLLNALLGHKGLARVSSTPGRTRSINYFLINRRCYLVDLPGYGYAKAGRADRRQWAELVESYLSHLSGRRRAIRAALVHLIDGKVGSTPLDVEARRYLAGHGLPMLVVATKIDRVGRGSRARSCEEIRRSLELPEGQKPIPLSAETGEGLGDLWRAMDAVLIAGA